MGSVSGDAAAQPPRRKSPPAAVETSGGEGVGDDGGVALSPTARLFRQKGFNCHIVAAMGCSKRLDADAIAAGIEKTIARHPRFSSILVSDPEGKRSPRWVQAKVVASDHIVEPYMDPAHPDPDRLVEDYISSLPSSELDVRRPLWDLHLLNLRTSAAESVAVFRCHHSLGDGISLMSLLLACCRKTSDPSSPPSLPAAAAGAPAGNHLSLISVWSAVLVLWRTFVDAALFAATSVFLKDTRTSLMGGEGVEFNPKRFVHRSVCLDDIKDVKRAMGCTVNDVLLGVTSAALSRYLGRKFGGTYDGKKNNLPKHLRIRSTLLVNIRKTPGIHELADMMETGSATKWGNYLGYVLLPFAVGIPGDGDDDDPLDYVRRSKAIADWKKGSLEAAFSFQAANATLKLFGIETACAVTSRILRNTTFSFSNMVGPTEEVALFGFPMVYLAPSVYGHPQALTVHFQSYMNKMTIVLAVDDTLIPDPHNLLNDFAESLKLIKGAAAVASAGSLPSRKE